MNKKNRGNFDITNVVPHTNQKKTKTKVLSIALVFAMLFTLFQANIFAQVEGTLQEGPTVETSANVNGADTPSTQVPSTDTPSTEVPSTETPSTDTPSTEVPSTETPSTETPSTETPSTETPSTEIPSTEVPSTEVPSTETPSTDTPSTETPSTETPSTEVPSTETTSTETSSDDIEGKSEEDSGEIAIDSNAVPLAASLQSLDISAYSLPAAASQYTITYYSNYPADSGLTDKIYDDPTKYENGMSANAATLVQAGFETPENYYILGWNPSPSAGTAQYPEGVGLGIIDIDWDLYAVWMKYKTMAWSIGDSTYTSTYNSQSHTNSINWPTAYSTAWAGDVISGLTYEYSVNGGAFSAAKPELINAGNYTVTVKASAPLYTEITTTINVVINKAPLTITPNVAGSYKYGSLSNIAYSIPAVSAANGPKSQADANAINNVIANTSPLFDAIDSSNNKVSDLATALPDAYKVNINSSALANLQNNSAFNNYSLSANSGSFNITALSGLTVSAKALNTTYNAQLHDAVNSVTSSVSNAKIEYSINGAAFTSVMPQVKNAGDYTVEIRASAPGYTDATITLTATVEKRDVTITIAQHSKTQGAADPTFSSSISGTQGSDKIAYTLNRTAGESVGDYAITADVVANSNYNIIVKNGLLIITAAPIIPTTPDVSEDPDTTPEETETTPDTDDEEETETPQEDEEETAFEQENAQPLDAQLPEEDVVENTQVDIGDTELPLATKNGAWALLNLILAIVTAITSVVLIAGYFINKRKDDDEDESINRKGAIRFTSIIVALISAIIFILTQDMSLEMVFVDHWTVFMVLLTLVQVVISAIAKKSIKQAQEAN